MRIRWLKTTSFALASRTRSFRVPSPTTGKIAWRTTSSGWVTAASARRKRMPCLSRTRRSSVASSPSTFFSARVSQRWTRPISRSTRPSVISVVRAQHRAASRVRRTGWGEARRSEGYSLAARARREATNFSEVSLNRSAGSPIARTRSALSTSSKKVSRLRGPGSAFISARRLRSPLATTRLWLASSGSDASSSSRTMDGSERRETVRVQNCRSLAAPALPRIRSMRLGPGGSMRSVRHRARRAARWPVSDSSTGHTSSASHTVSFSSSATVDSRKPSAWRTWER